MEPPTERRPNRLANETSPYLLQHAHNPVEWYPWGTEALERARQLDRPILLSVGYSACHWCHVMERESFENLDIARLMNDNFVCIKVDREERPDLDEVYMAATIAMTGAGGWPMHVFLTPEREPFFAGTYFPPLDMPGRPGFPRVLSLIAETWRRDRQGVDLAARELMEHLRAQSTIDLRTAVGPEAISRAAENLGRVFDPRYGGFGEAPKFPPATFLSMLLRHHHCEGDEQSLVMVKTTLDGMKNGGLYDQIGGGFARYSTDQRWLVPHFEKMLYDNALLSRIYLEAFQVTGYDEYRRVASETLDYLLREIQSPSGGFFSSTDADSEGVEGKFYLFRPDQIRAVLGESEAEYFCRYYGVSEEGNWEGSNILHTPISKEALAARMNISTDELARLLDKARKKVFRERLRRAPPALDDKILASWNALAIGALAEGYRVLNDPRYLQSATRAAAFVLNRMRRPDGGLYRTARGSVAHLDAYLEDYAYLADALIDLYEAGASAHWLAEAEKTARRIVEDFDDPYSGAFFHIAHGHEPLIVRTRDGQDASLPSANAVAARALARLSFHLDRPELRERAVAAINAFGKQIERVPEAFATALAVVDFLARGPLELALVGRPGDGDHEALRRAIGRRYLPNRIEAHLDSTRSGSGEETFESRLPLLRDKRLINGSAALYVCSNYACRAPVTDPAVLDDALRAI